MEHYTDFFRDDITWCINNCDRLDCRRNVKNRDVTIFGMYYSGGLLKDTAECLLTKEKEEKTHENS